MFQQKVLSLPRSTRLGRILMITSIRGIVSKIWWSTREWLNLQLRWKMLIDSMKLTIMLSLIMASIIKMMMKFKKKRTKKKKKRSQKRFRNKMMKVCSERLRKAKKCKNNQNGRRSREWWLKNRGSKTRVRKERSTSWSRQHLLLAKQT